MAIHSSILIWRIPWTEEPDSPQGCTELDTTKVTQQQHHHHLLENFSQSVTNVSPFTPIPQHAPAFLSYLEYFPLSTKKFKSFQWHRLSAGFYDIIIGIIIGHYNCFIGNNPVSPKEMEKKSTWNLFSGYCYVTNYPKAEWLKTRQFMMFYVCGLMGLSQAVLWFTGI